MEKVSGIGGWFFRARDPESLGKWYRDHHPDFTGVAKILGVLRKRSECGRSGFLPPRQFLIWA
jgi:hypothetical protein